MPRFLLSLLAAVPLLAGCGLPPDEIRSYDAPRVEIPPLDSVPDSEVKYRILGVIAPADDGAFFFKAGPAEAAGIAALEKDFDTWVTTIGSTAPKGWTEVDPGKMNIKAFTVGEGDKAVRVTIAKASGTLLANVNRWRGQVGLKPASQAQMDLVTSPVAIGEKPAFRVDIRGASLGTPTMPGAKTGPGPIEGNVMPDNHPPVDGGSGPKAPASVVGGKKRILGVAIPQGAQTWFFKIGPVPADSLDSLTESFDTFMATVKPGAERGSPPTFNVPASWRKGKGTSISYDSYMIAPNVEMTITLTGGSLAENLNRWLGQVGVPAVRTTNPADIGKEITVGGQKAYRIDATGAGGNGGMMVPPK